MDSKEVNQKERRTLLDLILQVIRESQQQRDKGVSRRCSSGLYTAPQDMKFSSREKPFYVPRLDNSRLIEIVPRDLNMKSKFIQHFTGPGLLYTSILQKMCEVTNAASNESTLHAIIEVACFNLQKRDQCVAKKVPSNPGYG
ncbi:hypothetical protein WMY93_025039 [Mugilogobius chulae]|uniref:Uncharacterized protein n=1 Tax=Mugilogobius chulae TaxID=88201 RepID=A0AAW0N5P7_9GOBI